MFDGGDDQLSNVPHGSEDQERSQFPIFDQLQGPEALKAVEDFLRRREDSVNEISRRYSRSGGTPESDGLSFQINAYNREEAAPLSLSGSPMILIVKIYACGSMERLTRNGGNGSA